MNRREFLTRTLPLAGIAACTKPPAPALRVGTFAWPGYDPLVLARDLGAFTEQEARIVEFPTSAEGMLSFQNGVVDAMTVTLDEALRVHHSGTPLSIVLVLDYSAGADAILAKPELENMAALRGKKVGFEVNNLGAYMLTRALEVSGMTIADIQPVSLRSDRLEGAYTRGDVDAVVTFDPYRTRLLARGARNVFDSSRLPGEILDVLAVRDIAATTHGAQLRRLVDGWFAAHAHIAAQPADAASRLAPREKITPDEMLAAWKLINFPDRAANEKLLAPGGELAGKAARLADYMQRNKLITGPSPAGELCDPQFLRKEPQ